MRRVVSWMLIALLVLVPVSGVVAFSVVQAQDPEQLAPKPTAVLQQPTSVLDDAKTDATITANSKSGVSVLAPNWQGIVTAVHIVKGTSVSTGTPLLDVDGVTRTAVASATPFYRSLAEGMAGTDVQALETTLRAMGYFKGKANTKYDASTAAAVKKLEKKIGINPQTGVFDPAWFVWMPGENLTADSIPLTVNKAAPMQGEEVFSTAPTVDTIKLAASNATFAFDGNTPYILSQNGQDVTTVRSDGDVNLELIGKLTATEDAVSTAGGSANAGGTTYSVQLRSEQAKQMLSIPSSAVMTDASGAKTCVFGKFGQGESTYQSLPVTVADGSLGVTHVEPDENVAKLYVLTDPLTIMGNGATCPSN